MKINFLDFFKNYPDIKLITADVFCVVGQDDFLKREVFRLIRKQHDHYFLSTYNPLQKQDFLEILNLCTTQNIFKKEQQLIEINVSNSSLVNKDNQLVLLSIIEKKLPEICLFLNFIEKKKSPKTTFFIKKSTQILVNKINFTDYCSIKLSKSRIDLDKHSFLYLVDLSMNNPYSFAQNINKLAFVYQKNKINLISIRKIVEDGAKYSIFDFINAFFSGNKKLSLRILFNLEKHHVEPLLLVWHLQKNLEVMIAIYYDNAEKTNSINIYQKKMLQKFLINNNVNFLNFALNLLVDIDLQIKTTVFNWQSFTHLILKTK